MFTREREQPPLLLDGCRPPERVRRRGVEQQAGARRDGRFERVEVDRVAGAVEGLRQLDGRGIGQLHDGGAVRPGGREADGLIPGVEDAADRQVERLDARGRDDHLARGIELDVVQARVLAGDRAAKRGQAGVLRVERVAVLERLHRGLLDEVGRRLIGLAEVQPQHVGHGHGHLGQLADPRVGDTQDRVGEREAHQPGV